MSTPRKGVTTNEAGARPLCDCHAEPMYWQKAAQVRAGGYWYCRQRYRASEKRWRDANRDHLRAYMRQWHADRPGYASARRRKDRYGVSPEEIAALKARQGGRCALCDLPEAEAPKGALHIDHDHVTGRIRGLLCLRCNTSMERMDRPGWLERAQAYLAK